MGSGMEEHILPSLDWIDIEPSVYGKYYDSLSLHFTSYFQEEIDSKNTEMFTQKAELERVGHANEDAAKIEAQLLEEISNAREVREVLFGLFFFFLLLLFFVLFCFFFLQPPPPTHTHSYSLHPFITHRVLPRPGRSFC